MRSLVLAALTVAALPSVAELRLELVRESLIGTHCRYREYINGIPNDEYVVEDRQSCLSGQAGLPVLHSLFRLNNRIVRRTITQDHFAEDRDVETGALIRRIPLFFNAKAARVFDPNPVASLNDQNLHDNNDDATAVPEAAYKNVDLDNINDTGALKGPHIALVDKQAPFIAPPNAEGSLVFNRNDDGFEDVNAYFHVDRMQKRLRALGYTGSRAIAPYAVETDAHAAGGVDNSFFLPSPSAPGTGSLFFGIGGTDDAEDADLVVHEYGHALLEWIAPGTFGGTFNSQARAFSEGFGDYLSFSSHYEQRIASGRDPYCFADWDTRCWNDAASENCAYRANTDCLRRLDSTRTMADYETSEGAGVEHRNGMIWSSAMREIFHALGRDVTDTILIESTFGAPPSPTFAIMARRLIEADRLIYGGTHASAICAAMTSRGIVTSGTCAISPRGEWTHFPATQHFAIPDADPAGIVSPLTVLDTRTIENVFVRVDIAHPSRGDLRIELVAPDGTVVLLQQVSFERTRDVRVTFGIDANPVQPLTVLRGRPANGEWQLRVIDLRRLDVGTLLSWGLVFQFAGDAPLADRPRRTPSQMIPVVAHRHGAFDTFFASELRIANVKKFPAETATLIFTPSGADGRTAFSAVNISLLHGQAAGYDDVLTSLFNTTGSGSLEILGDVVVTSRTYTRRGGGTLGQQVPPNLATARRSLENLILGGFPEEHQRYNLGLTETEGVEVTVRVGGQSHVLPPYSHVQFPVSGEWQFVQVVDGQGAVIAYISQVDNTTGDAMFIEPESTFRFRGPALAPAVDAAGVSGTRWRSDYWLAHNAPSSEILDFVDAGTGEATRTSIVAPTAVTGILGAILARTPAAGVLTTTRAGLMFHGTRIMSNGTSQFIPFRPRGTGGTQQLLFIENTPEFRTNIGIVDSGPVSADVIVYGDTGASIAHYRISSPHGFAQIAVTVPVTNGRAEVRFDGNTGYAYASLIDNATGDATYFRSQ